MRLPESDQFTFKCEEPEKLAFINGVNVDRTDAERAAVKIRDIARKPVGLIYNTSEELTKDIGQAIAQKTAEYDGSGSIFDRVSIAFLSKAITISGVGNYTSEEISVMKEALKAMEVSKYKIVAHSQGNLFANIFCKEAKIKPKIIHLANPSSVKSECEEVGISFSNDPVLIAIDLVVKFAKAPALKTLPANDKFERGKAIDMALLNELVHTISTAEQWDKFTKGFFETLSYNHDFLSYLQRDPSSSSKVRRSLERDSKINYEERLAFSVGINRLDPLSPDIVKSAWGYYGKDSFAGITCKMISEVPDGYISLLPGVSRNQLVIKTNKERLGLKRAPYAPITAGVIERNEEDPFQYTLRSASAFEIAKKAIGL